MLFIAFGKQCHGDASVQSPASWQRSGVAGCKVGRCHIPCSRPDHCIPLGVVQKHWWKQCLWLPVPDFLSMHLIFCDEITAPWEGHVCSVLEVIACLLLQPDPLFFYWFYEYLPPCSSSFSLNCWKGSRYSIPKYSMLAWELFWTKGSWERADTEKLSSLPLHA